MESNQYHLDTIVAVALSIPRDGEKRLKWTEAKFVGGGQASGSQTMKCFELVGQKILLLTVSR